MSELTWLDPDTLAFPSTHNALEDPNGLLAVGGDLSPARLLHAYSLGIFPWFDESQPILWWTPNPRLVLKPSDIHHGRTFKKLANKRLFTVTVDTCFNDVVSECAASIHRSDGEGTWITDEMIDAYSELHQQGHAHSIEVWQDEQLVGGLYGIAIGRFFYGESMFSAVSGASKIGFATLVKQLDDWGFIGIDCQVHTQYLASFGALELPRTIFEALLKEAQDTQSTPNVIKWATAWQCPPYGIAFN